MAVDAPKITGPHAGLLDWLASRHVEYELCEHPETFTAEATARAEHVDPKRFVKVVGVAASDGRRVLLLVDAPDHVDLAKARRVLGAADVRLLTEAEFAALAPECDARHHPTGPGAVRPVRLRRLRPPRRADAVIPRREPPVHRPRRSGDLGAVVGDRLCGPRPGRRRARLGPVNGGRHAPASG